MNDMANSPACERTSDLMAFLYNEMNEGETREFELHLRACSNCREEAASFGLVRESIVAWRDEALAGFVSTPVPVRKSAIAALRQFFDLSPLWLKGAAAFAVLTFCLPAGLLFVNFNKENTVAVNADAVYTQQDVDRLVNEALAKQKQQPVVNPREETPVVVVNTPPRKPLNKPATKSNRPLSRAEREQLAADLRLLPTDDDLDLFGDRINE